MVHVTTPATVVPMMRPATTMQVLPLMTVPAYMIALAVQILLRVTMIPEPLWTMDHVIFHATDVLILRPATTTAQLPSMMVHATTAASVVPT